MVLNVSHCQIAEVWRHDDIQLVRITGDAVQLGSSDIIANTDCHNSRHVRVFQQLGFSLQRTYASLLRKQRRQRLRNTVNTIGYAIISALPFMIHYRNFHPISSPSPFLLPLPSPYHQSRPSRHRFWGISRLTKRIFASKPKASGVRLILVQSSSCKIHSCTTVTNYREHTNTGYQASELELLSLTF